MSDDRPGFLSYVVGGLSFIPLIGVFFGGLAILWGLIKIRNGGLKLILIGALGICFTVFIYGTLFYKVFAERGGVFDELRTGMAQSVLTDLVKSVEYYKLQKGKYPEELEELVPEGEQNQQGFIMIYDPTFTDFKTEGTRLFHYELINKGKNYYLLSIGPDGIVSTEDDIYPVVTEDEIKNIGYMKKEL